MKFGLFYEHQLPRPWDDDSEYKLLQDALEQCELADKLGFQYVLGGRAPLPRGVLPLQRARGVPRRGVAAHEEHPARSRHRADAAARSTTRPASPSASPRSTSSRTGASTSAPASRRRRRSSAGSCIDPDEKRAMWEEGLRVAVRCMTEEPFTGFSRRVRHDAAAQRRAQAAPEAAPAGVGRVQPARHDPPRRAEGHRRARVRVRRSRRSAVLGRRLLHDARDARACRSATR